MPRKQRFKPTRKPKLTTDGAMERTEEQQNRSPAEESSMVHRTEEQDSERRSE